MSVYALKPNFTDRESYREWKATWRTVYQHISSDIRRRKLLLKAEQRAGADTARMQRNLRLQSSDARKMMTLLGEAIVLRDRIRGMHEQLAEQARSFPLTLNARVVDFSFNKIHNSFSFMPRWLVRANGRTFYVDHLDARIGFSTREMTDPKTKGMLRFRNATMEIGADGVAVITEKVVAKLAA